jgi:hypothetical protein
MLAMSHNTRTVDRMTSTPGAGPTPKMRDLDLRRALTATVTRKLGSTPHVLVPEVDIRWSVPARADALLVSDRICGFEIKSDVDSLARLPRQVLAYGQVVERAYLLVGEKYRERATAIVPEWWAIWAASWAGDDVRVRQVRAGRLNPDINPLAVTTFLSREQLTRTLNDLGEKRLSSVPVDDLRGLLVARLGARRTVAVARGHLLDREDWRAKTAAGSAL